jgi:hypothetical protein
LSLLDVAAHVETVSNNQKRFYDIVVSSGKTMGAFTTGFETVNLHRLTLPKPRVPIKPLGQEGH